MIPYSNLSYIFRIEKYKLPENKALLLPYNFSALLNFLAAKARQEKIREDIYNK